MMLEGLKRLNENKKFSYALDVAGVEKEYILHSDNVQVFEEHCLRDCSGNEQSTDKSHVYIVYTEWCNKHILTPVKQKVFTKKIDKIGRKVHNTTTWDADTKKGRWFSCYFNTIVEEDPDQTKLKCNYSASPKPVG